MNKIEELLNRSSQISLAIGQKIIGYANPKIIRGADCTRLLPKKIKEDGIETVLIVAGSRISLSMSMYKLIQALGEEGIKTFLYDKAQPNPTVENVLEGYKIYEREKCQGIIAFGGGSSMDCGKAIGAKVAQPKKSIHSLRGALKVGKGVPPIYAIPTTAGTGSEATLGAVITDGNHKYSINDYHLIPKIAVLDPKNTVTMPKSVTVYSGMDALSHSVEAYINLYGQRKAYKWARESCQIVMENLPRVLENPNDLELRGQMMKGAFLAGCAISRNCVGYVHGMGHPLSGLYNMPHGLAMAILLPKVLREYGDAVEEKLEELAIYCNLVKGKYHDGASIFINKLESLNRNFEIGSKLPMIRPEDIGRMSKYAIKEVNSTYPVPVLWDRKKIKSIYKDLI